MNLKDITDPSDFKTTKLPALAELDILKRCYICKDLLNAPVRTQCDHTYCSQCIREFLLRDNRCPLCKTEVFESGLKRDPLLEEIVISYASLRPHLLRLLEIEKVESKQEVDREKSANESASNGNRNVNNDVDETVRVKDQSNADELGEEKGQAQHGEQVNEQTTEVISLLSDDEENGSDSLVKCPICFERMELDVLQGKHIDDCLSGKSTKRTPTDILSPKAKRPKQITSFFKPTIDTKTPSPPTSKASTTPTATPTTTLLKANVSSPSPVAQSTVHKGKPLPKLDFSSLSTQKIKAKLSDLKLPTTGSRNEMEARYLHYYVIYNANLDSNHPVKESILRQQLKQWEMVQHQPSFGDAEWKGAETGNWKELIARARSN
ncbi:postreplication repair E3 ubiquitin-protein ligase RAD18 [Candida albicans P57072]|uniref:Postreplication repair E3 ubiquitin-protein ligase RAD18 n=3 Tax=Candida albicans TaxID=5476 RepID=RAD18_CANAL|nr:E3 ubiquitin-protein ligase [Candida albicans SC5314]Q5A4N5.2 RecName: Full=Postreplication repair E3 ubiquitin-protein ligase RAD18; AltName: Full=RING-type E3 ubiquitin transferase RAD18 [Candida albicans SC5314]KAF6070935.1 DNA repair protein rad18 [Candida albicans]KGQ86051.1 postreplication repair E3 ubiquitin-protein ligase RAD18 [Candida albicans P37005]KGR04921.1 postreplication repair E3 ubiquitin-protein ligase RAD18 [Candida albicans P57072]KGR07397.1 postreplication repair E3 ub|eukprot:XP_716717.2 E3 ubiquitin-protein ligase [Candida albicans SC5314]